jgi:hypothetical protein
MTDHRDALSRAQDRAASLLAELDEVRALHHRNRDALKDQHEASWRGLAEALVPALDARLDDAARALSLYDLELEVVEMRLKERRGELEAKRDELSATPGFAAAETELADIIRRREELDDHLESLDRSLKPMEADPEFRALYDSGYGTEDDSVSFWQLSYYRRRGEAEDAAKRYGAPDFLTLRQRFETERAARRTLRHTRKELETRRTALGTVARLYAETVQGLGSLKTSMLEELRAKVERELRCMDVRTILEREWPDDIWRIVFAIDGTLAKTRYLLSSYTHFIDDRHGRMRAVAQDLDLALEGDMSRWYVMGGNPAEIDHRVEELVREVRRSRSSYERIAERLIGFARFERFQPGDLWWDYMCGGAFEGAFIDEVVWHRTYATRSRATPMDVRSNWDQARERAEATLAARLASAPSAPEPVDLD